jgi:uncharacterized protein (TIGR02001 family)
MHLDGDGARRLQHPDPVRARLCTCFADSKGSGYLDLSANVELGDGWSLVPHVGRQWVRRNSASSYTDYAITLNKDFGHGLVASAAVVGTNADKALYVTPSGRFTGRGALVLGLKYTF